MTAAGSSLGDDPAQPDDRALHQRLLRGDPTAPSDLVLRHLGPLIAWLGERFRRQDPALLGDIATDLLLSIAERPAQYDPAKASLPAYLHMAARRDVMNALEKEQRRVTHLAPLDDVELQPRARNILVQGEHDPAVSIERADAERQARRLIETFDGHDRGLVELLLAGERRSEPYAILLGLEARPKAEQQQAVKRAKDRLTKMLRRRWQAMEQET